MAVGIKVVTRRVSNLLSELFGRAALLHLTSLLREEFPSDVHSLALSQAARKFDESFCQPVKENTIIVPREAYSSTRHPQKTLRIEFLVRQAQRNFDNISIDRR